MSNGREELKRFDGLPFDLEVQLDRRTLRIRDLLELGVGSLMRLNRHPGENFDVLVGGARIGSGEMVVVGETMAVRLIGLERGR